MTARQQALIVAAMVVSGVRTRRGGGGRRRAGAVGIVLGALMTAGLYGPDTAARAAGTESAAAGTAAGDGGLWFDGRAAAEVTPDGTRFTDGHGREVVLRGFNVSGETKLHENRGLPFANTADARASAEALRDLTGGNTVRFLLSWAYAEPEPGRVDEAYLAAVTAQMGAFLDAGLRVYPDFHQDLYSRYLFHEDSWYTGDGAPRWAVEAGGYPREFCGICVHWGQNITQNRAVMDASRDFWHNRVLETEAGPLGVQDAFLATAGKTMAHLKEHLTEDQFAGIAGFDPYNEPYAGTYEDGENSRSWERDTLAPFYERFRARMDAAGWQDKPAFLEPNMFWNSNIGFQHEEGGFLDAGRLGPRSVFNTHFYDQRAISGILMPGKARDGQNLGDFEKVRERSAATGVPAVVSEFGHPLNGLTADKAPTVLKAMYQALDSRLPGRDWWRRAAESGPVLSAQQWQWDIYSGRHREPMNGNPDKVLTEGDAWNDEDLSAVERDASGELVLRQDERLLDRLYPTAVSGRTLAFVYEDRSRDGDRTLTWNRIPDDLPHVAELTGSGRYGMLVWRSDAPDGGAEEAPTELHLPRGFDPERTVVVSDLGTAAGPPPYAADGRTARHPVATAPEAGGTDARRLLLSPPAAGEEDGEPGGRLHFALIAEGTAPAPPELREEARRELAGWAARAGFGG
ncbi:cellulase family glycosylhydrolase [Streptomyces sp. MNU89]|nr:cellulase family glycosylhydrolase [Streptomyces sp. MNU89]MCC9742166.1 cellulase family glycosylhydrolase [Streptomyces sp. MNU89]